MPDATSPPRSPPVIVLSGWRALAVLAVFASVLIGFIVLMLSLATPSGDKVASLNLLAPYARAAFDGQRGDRIEFQSDVGAEVPSRAIRQALPAATLTVRVEGPDGARELSCAMFDETSTFSSSGTPSRGTVYGIQNACALVLGATGRYVLRASVSWASLRPTEATLEVLRDR